jgi:hypothetical protein
LDFSRYVRKYTDCVIFSPGMHPRGVKKYLQTYLIKGFVVLYIYSRVLQSKLGRNGGIILSDTYEINIKPI